MIRFPERKGENMTLKDLISAGLIKDDTKIEISKKIIGNMVDLRKGNWFNDQILDYMNLEIKSFSYDCETGFSIALK